MAAATQTKVVEEVAVLVEPMIVRPPVAQTSLAARGTNPGEVTVQFRRWHQQGMTAYQRGQFAGFPIGVALEMERVGACLIDPAYVRTGFAAGLIRK